MFKLPCESNNISVKEEDFASWYFDVICLDIIIFVLCSHHLREGPDPG